MIEKCQILLTDNDLLKSPGRVKEIQFNWEFPFVNFILEL